MAIELGYEAEDKITGFKGIVTGHCEYLYGCDQYLLTPPVREDGSKISGEWIDEGRVQVIGKGVPAEAVQADKPGGLRTDCPPCK